MLKWTFWVAVILATVSSSLQTRSEKTLPAPEIRPKRRPSEAEVDRQMVTIDLSALRPSLPGLVLYKYGEMAPKLVQVDLSALNPQLQPHVIWPQFDELDLMEERPLEFDTFDAIPYLSDENPLLLPKPQRMAKMTADPLWPAMDDLTDNDIYDFIPDSNRNEELMSLHGSLPVADEVIIPLDWEEGQTNRNSEKRNVFMSRGWTPGGQGNGQNKITNQDKSHNTASVPKNLFNIHYTPFGPTKWTAGKKETESEENKEDTLRGERPRPLGKKNIFISGGWGPGGRPASTTGLRKQGAQRRGDGKVDGQPVRIPSQESWSVPRQYWNVPHLIGSYWQ